MGDTPLVRLNRMAKEAGAKADILLKLEFFNPLSSVKDRIGVSMIETLEEQGIITPGKSVLVEPTSGNTGIALAFVAAAKGYRLILVMPESMSIERRKMLLILGAEIELTEAAKGMRGAIAKAQETGRHNSRRGHAATIRKPREPGNPSPHDGRGNLERHQRRSRCRDLWCGHRRHDHGRRPGAQAEETFRQMIALEPEDSPVLSGGQPGPHKIQGIGAGFVPAILDRNVIDEIITISNETAFETARKAARLEGNPGRHFLGRGHRGRSRSGCASGDGGQDHRRNHPFLRRTLSLHSLIRRALNETALPRRKQGVER